MEFRRYPSIEQFRHIIKQIKSTTKFIGVDDCGNAIYDKSIELPTLRFTGTEKIHGTNASVCMDKRTGEFWCQSRKNIITVEKDNAGFAFFVESRKKVFEELFASVQKFYGGSIISIFGEFAGGNIQKTSCCSNLEKRFIIFDIQIDGKWVDIKPVISSPENLIFNVSDFKTWEIDIDFKNPLLSQNKMIELMKKVEEASPIGSTFGEKNIGEGIVFKGEYKGDVYRFKVKGDKHSKSKVKTLKKVNTKKLNKITQIATLVTPNWRLDQMYCETFDTVNGGKGDIKKTGDYIRSVIRDVMKEDLDLIIETGLEPKEINKTISDISRKYLINRLDQEAIC